ncbi:hypothetical protein D3C77_383510 [compost metagenome]
MVDQVKMLEHHSQGQRGLMHGKLLPDARPLTITEGLEGMMRNFPIILESFGPERFDVFSPCFLVAMQLGD